MIFRQSTLGGRTSRPIPREVSLRDANPSDLGDVRSLLRGSELPLDGVEDQFGDAYVVADDGSRVVGVAGVEVHGRYALFRSLAVSEDHRGSRIGEALTTNRLDWAVDRGFVTIFLLTLIPDYFDRFGFQRVERHSAPLEIRRTQEFSVACPETATLMALPVSDPDDETREHVRSKYAEIARRVEEDAGKGSKKQSSCCGPDCGANSDNPVTSGLYTDAELEGLPQDMVSASLGCGNPTALTGLNPGETVLDLGSGAGLDVLLSARRVGESGKAYGLDMTDEMLEVARHNQRDAGIQNAEFLKGHIEAIPLPDASVDVVISNCVINLSIDKPQVFREIFRVLRPGGRVAVSDIVSRGPIAADIRKDLDLWAGCVAGSLDEADYRRFLEDAGFADVEIEPTRIYDSQEICARGTAVEPGREFAGEFMSAFVRAVKPKTV